MYNISEFFAKSSYDSKDYRVSGLIQVGIMDDELNHANPELFPPGVKLSGRSQS